MRAAFHELWGCAHGPVSKLAPQTRIVVGAAVFAACVVAPAPDSSGTALIAALTVLWLSACRVPLRVVRTASLLGLTLFLPYFLTVPLIAGAVDSNRWWTASAVPLGILVHGMSGMLVSIGLVTALTGSELREGLLRLPVPNLVAAILLQIVHQTGALGYETRRVAAAMAVRGASGGGMAAWRVLASLPQVWLPRVIQRAERVAAAMELRGYCEQDLPSFGQDRARWPDAFALALSAVAVGLAGALRYWGLM